LTTGGTTTTQ
jgi:hypothetical protein